MTYGMKGGDANRQSPTKIKRERFAHTANTPYGMGDYYGTGIKQKVGTLRRDYLNNSTSSNKKYCKPPKSMA
jgi:hypothetical protein